MITTQTDGEDGTCELKLTSALDLRVIPTVTKQTAVPEITAAHEDNADLSAYVSNNFPELAARVLRTKHDTAKNSVSNIR